MDIGASEHWGKMGIWGKCTSGKMSTWTKQQLGQMGTLEQMGILRPMDIGQLGQMSTLGKWVFGTNGYVETGTMDVWGNEHLRANGHFGTNEHWG